MGYFANGTEGLDYQQAWCRRCMHGDGDSAGECAVWEAHLALNYKMPTEAPNPLHILIPIRSADGIENDQCRMFIRGGQRRLPF